MQSVDSKDVTLRWLDIFVPNSTMFEISSTGLYGGGFAGKGAGAVDSPVSPSRGYDPPLDSRGRRCITFRGPPGGCSANRGKALPLQVPFARRPHFKKDIWPRRRLVGGSGLYAEGVKRT